MPSEGVATRRWLLDIQHHIDMAQGFVAGVKFETFRDDNMRLYAVTRCLEIVSEASRRLPDDLKARNPSIEWRAMAAAGNIYRHEYEDVAAGRVWQTLTVVYRCCSRSSSTNFKCSTSSAWSLARSPARLIDYRCCMRLKAPQIQGLRRQSAQ